jgi:hypothetical protein
LRTLIAASQAFLSPDLAPASIACALARAVKSPQFSQILDVARLSGVIELRRKSDWKLVKF